MNFFDFFSKMFPLKKFSWFLEAVNGAFSWQHAKIVFCANILEKMPKTFLSKKSILGINDQGLYTVSND